MSLYTLPNSTTGYDSIATQLITSVPELIPIFLAFTFFVVLLGGIVRQKERIGTADVPMWSVIASISTLMVSLILSMVSGFIQLGWLIIVVVITIFSGVWLFLDRKPSEL